MALIGYATFFNLSADGYAIDFLKKPGPLSCRVFDMLADCFLLMLVHLLLHPVFLVDLRETPILENLVVKLCVEEPPGALA